MRRRPRIRAGSRRSLGAQTLNVVMASRLSVLDPVLTTAHQTRNHGYMIYDTLVATDAENKIRPQMASWNVSPTARATPSRCVMD